MKRIMFLLCIIFLSSVVLFPQVTRTFSSKENYFNTWYRMTASGDKGALSEQLHYVGTRGTSDRHECRSFQYWEWSYSQIPTEAVVQSVNIKFRAAKDDANHTFHYSFHNILHKSSETSIVFFDECTSSNKIFENTETATNNNIIFDLTFNAQSPVGGGREVWDAIQTAVQNGNYFFTLGIQELGSQLNPHWFLTPYNGTYTSVPSIDLTIIYTITDPTVTIEQKLSSGASVGTLRKWEGSAFGQPFSPGASYPFIVGSTQTIQATQSVYSNEKYNNWNGYTNVNNHKSFTIRPSLTLLTANLAPTYSGIIIRNYIDEVVGGGNIEFKDPWLNDYADPAFGNTLRNSDSLAVFYSRSSPFNPDYSTSYNGLTYKGVFLNENIAAKSIYSVRTQVNQDIYLSQTNKTHKCYFQNWGGTNVSYYQNETNPSGYDQKDVAFTSSNAVASANFKATQLSNDASAFSNNSQRRLIETLSGGVTWLHQVYTSMGHIWIEHSSNGGSSWILGNNGQPLTGSAGGKCPSISFGTHSPVPGTINNYIGVVWQEKNGTTYKIKGKIFNQFDSTPIPRPETSEIWNETTDTYNAVNANPNILMANGVSSYYMVAFEKKSTSGGLQPGINLLVGYTTDGGGWELGEFGVVQYKKLVTGTNANSTNVQLSLYPGNYELLADIIYQTSSVGAVYDRYINIFYSDYWRCYEYDPILLSYPTGDVNFSPSIVTLTDYWFAASWVEYDQLAFYNGSSSVRSYYNSGVQSTSINRGGSSGNSGFVVWSQNPPVGWSNKSMRFDNGSPVGGSLSTLSTSGKYVQVGNGANTDLSNMRVSSFYPFSSPYYFSTTGTLGPLSKENSDISEGRGFIINREDAYFIYRFEDLNVDGKNIGFIDAPDSADYSKLDILNNALVTEPFQIGPKSKVVFTERSGFADSAAAVKALDKNGFVRCRVELVDDATGSVIGAIKNNNFTSSNVHSFKIPSYSLDTKGFDNRTARVKITLETNVADGPSSKVTNNSLSAEITEKMMRPNISSPCLILTKSYVEGNQTLAKSSLNELTIDDLDIPTTYALEQNYPNPFNPSTTINYQLPSDGMVTLKIYDALGREVKTLVEEFKQKGRYSINFNASELASGVYFYRINVNDFSTTKKLMLLK